MQSPLPPEFTTRMAASLGPSAFQEFSAALQQAAPTSLRLNPLKPLAESPPFGGTALPWEPLGYVLHQRPSFTFHPPFHAGAYYVQEANSMLVGAAVYEWLRGRALPTAPLLALDLCAAPGGKTTQLATLLPSGSLLVANEVIAARADVLRQNVIKWGHPDVLVTQNDPNDFAPLAGQFHLVVVDAPCSGEGLWRRQPEAIAEWSPQAVAHCALRQQRILALAASLVAPGGLLVYSTCTWAHAEDEAQVASLLAQPATHDAPGWLPLPLPQAAEWGLLETDAGAPAYRCYPHRTPGEGFFMCALRRQGAEAPFAPAAGKPPKAPRHLPHHLPLPTGWVAWQGGEALLAAPPQAYAFRAHCPARLRWRWDAWPVAEAKGPAWAPAPEWALCTAAAPQLPSLTLPDAQALRYLSGEAIAAPPGTPAGWLALHTEAGPRLGWAKHTNGRLNNAWPRAWRIRSALPTEGAEPQLA